MQMTDTKTTPTLKTKEPTGEIVTLKQLCVELKIDSREAREKLRIAARDPRKFAELKKSHQSGAAWEWKKGSMAEKEARGVLSG
jgi:hypothetical protein